MSVQQQITAQFTDALNKQFTTAKLAKAADAMGKEAVEIMRERTDRRVDVNYSAFKDYKPRYKQFKARYIAGKVSSKTKAHYGKKTKYAAKSVDDKMRLTGQLFSDMSYSVNQAAKFGEKFSFSFRLFIAQRSAKKAQGLLRRGYNFFGVSNSGSNGQREQARIFAAANKVLNADMKNNTIRL